MPIDIAVSKGIAMTSIAASLAASASGRYLSWGVIHISVTNALIILAMVVVFVLALVLPFPGHGDDEVTPGGRGSS